MNEPSLSSPTNHVHIHIFDGDIKCVLVSIIIIVADDINVALASYF